DRGDMLCSFVSLGLVHTVDIPILKVYATSFPNSIGTLPVTPTTATGSLDGESIAGLNPGRKFGRKHFLLASVSHQYVGSCSARLTSVQAIRREFAAVRQQSDLRSRQETQVANDPVASSPLSSPA